MTKILEIKDKVIKFFGEYESFLYPVVKFIVALALFMVINNNIGYMARLNSFVTVLLLALVSCILPVNFIALVAAGLVLLHMYSLCMEAAVVTLAVFALVYLVYFRFAPKDGMLALMTPICFTFHCPFVLPIVGALMKKSYSVIAMISGTVCYYFLQGVHQNAKVLTNVSTEVDEEAISKFNVLIGQFLSNKEMYLTIGVLVVAYLVVYVLRRIPANHAWTLAIITGTVVEFVGLFIGYTVFNMTDKLLVLLIGGVVSMLIAFVFQFLFMDLDYARTERVQFEDDDYYYYVKAVPKKMVASPEKTVKRFGNTGSLGKKIEKTDSSSVDEEISRKVIAKELDIDESWLK